MNVQKSSLLHHARIDRGVRRGLFERFRAEYWRSNLYGSFCCTNNGANSDIRSASCRSDCNPIVHNGG